MLTGDTWYVQMSGQVYGPYSTLQMQGFVKEGRVVPNSQVSISPGQAFRPASAYKAFNPGLIKPHTPEALELTNPIADTEPLLRPVGQTLAPQLGAIRHSASNEAHKFKPVEYQPRPNTTYEPQKVEFKPVARPVAPALPVFNAKPIVQTTAAPVNAAPPAAPKTTFVTPPIEPQTIAPEASHPNRPESIVLLVMAEFRSGQAMGFLQAIQKEGTAQRIGDTVWLLKTQRSATELRNVLSQTLQREDRLFIMDSFNNKTAWFNIGSDMDRRIREFWNMDPSAQ